MSDKTAIGWTDATLPIIVGCKKISPGCKNCWAIPTAYRLAHNPNPKVSAPYAGTVEKRGNALYWTGQLNLLPERLQWALDWKEGRFIFPCSSSDLFHPAVPLEFIYQFLALVALTPRHTYQLLTKRPARMRETLSDIDWPKVVEHMHQLQPQTKGHELRTTDGVLPNLWLGVSVENQQTANERIPYLLQTPAALHWISAEPLLSQLDLSALPHAHGYGCSPCTGCGEAVHINALTGATHCRHGCDGPTLPALGWVVDGGETGTRTKIRQSEFAWFRHLRDQCAAHGIPYTHKQNGTRLGGGNLLDGKTHNARPAP